MRTRTLIGIGLFFFLSLALLAVMTVSIQEFTFRDKSLASIVFSRVRGLEVGDPVLVLGAEIGKVHSITVRPREGRQRRVLVAVATTEPIVLFDDYRILLRENSLIGGQRIDVDPGAEGEPFVADPERVLQGMSSTTAFEGIEELIRENRDSVHRIVENLETLTDRMRAGEGLVGSLFADRQLQDDVLGIIHDVQATATDLREIVADVKAGEGTLGRFLRDETIFEDARETLAAVREAGESVGRVGELLETGDGSLAKFLREPTIHDQVVDILEDARTLTADLTEGRGTLGRLWQDETLYDRVTAVMDDLEAITGKVRAGEGTLGKLVNDDALHEDLTAAIRGMRGSLEDAREAAPIATFAGLLFAAF